MKASRPAIIAQLFRALVLRSGWRDREVLIMPNWSTSHCIAPRTRNDYHICVWNWGFLTNGVGVKKKPYPEIKLTRSLQCHAMFRDQKAPVVRATVYIALQQYHFLFHLLLLISDLRRLISSYCPWNFEPALSLRSHVLGASHISHDRWLHILRLARHSILR